MSSACPPGPIKHPHPHRSNAAPPPLIAHLLSSRTRRQVRPRSYRFPRTEAHRQRLAVAPTNRAACWADSARDDVAARLARDLPAKHSRARFEPSRDRSARHAAAPVCRLSIAQCLTDWSGSAISGDTLFLSRRSPGRPQQLSPGRVMRKTVWATQRSSSVGLAFLRDAGTSRKTCVIGHSLCGGKPSR